MAREMRPKTSLLLYNVKFGLDNLWAWRYGVAKEPQEGLKWGPKRDDLTYLKCAEKQIYPQRYSSMMAWRQNSTFCVRANKSQMWAGTYLVPKDFDWPWHRGDLS